MRRDRVRLDTPGNYSIGSCPSSLTLRYPKKGNAIWSGLTSASLLRAKLSRILGHAKVSCMDGGPHVSADSTAVERRCGMLLDQAGVESSE